MATSFVTDTLLATPASVNCFTAWMALLAISPCSAADPWSHYAATPSLACAATDRGIGLLRRLAGASGHSCVHSMKIRTTG